ncbi:helix-turn-helix transcriptional regulator [Actinomadura coerulea]|uniref:helix-turn-helix transcriptional regulator n=1 Tax=Actinomadura coerulea TaxID=46159 RepID=UPI003421522C
MSKDLGTFVRSARVAHGWTQRNLADHLHCPRSTVSRLETGAQPLDDVATLRRLAEVLQIFPTALGITATVTVEPPAEDDVRRRQLLTTLRRNRCRRQPSSPCHRRRGRTGKTRRPPRCPGPQRHAHPALRCRTNPARPSPCHARVRNPCLRQLRVHTQLATVLPQLITNTRPQTAPRVPSWPRRTP